MKKIIFLCLALILVACGRSGDGVKKEMPSNRQATESLVQDKKSLGDLLEGSSQVKLETLSKEMLMDSFSKLEISPDELLAFDPERGGPLPK